MCNCVAFANKLLHYPQITLGQNHITKTYKFIYSSIYGSNHNITVSIVFCYCDSEYQNSVECQYINVGQPNCTCQCTFTQIVSLQKPILKI